jgi:hypothetical protein
MAVVIQDFEVVDEGAAPAAVAGPEASAVPAGEVPDLEELLAERRSRQDRVRTY